MKHTFLKPQLNLACYFQGFLSIGGFPQKAQNVIMETDLADLKAEELVKEISLDYSKTKPLNDTIAVIREFLLNLPDEQIKAAEAAAFIKDLGAPSDKVNLNFKKPDSVEIVGSYGLKTVAKPFLNVDLAVRMPKECFFEKDILNHRYHAKRCLYLFVIKRHLHSCSVVGQVEWSSFQDDARKPILVIHSGGLEKDIGYDFVIRIIPTVAARTFDLSKLSPSRNNVRAFQKGGSVHATPYYNSSILEDMFLEEHAAFLQKYIGGSKPFVEALLLLKVWARQRNSINAPDCMNGFLMAIILAYLTTGDGGQRVKMQMTGLQAFRVVIDFIAMTGTLEKGIFIQPKSNNNLSLEQKKSLLQSFDFIICDPSGYLNLAFRITKSGLVELRDEAAQTLTYMNTCKDRGFEEVFMTKVDFAAKFDYYARINPVDNEHRKLSNCCLDKENWRAYEKEVESLLCKGLGERARLIRVIPRSVPAKWKIDEGHACLAKIPLLVGILVSNYEKAFRMADVGPSADNKDESVKFRNFWGDKAQLRRFKDGTIAETAVWECEQWEKHLIIKKIMEHIFCRHLSLSSQDFCIIIDQLDFSLMQGDQIASTSILLDAFDVLSKRLRTLEGLPLIISSVQPLDSAFRQTSVFPPMPHPLASEKVQKEWSQKLIPTCIQPLEVMIQFEGSGKWPIGDLAIEKTKSAFCLKIAESMQKQWGVFTVAAEDAVDLLMGGFAFRLRVLYEKDKSLLKKQGIFGMTLAGNPSWSNAVPLETDFLLRSQHASMLNGLQGLHPTYGPTVRLAKRWICSHLFSGFLAEEAVELLVAYIFVRPFPFNAPRSRMTGFLRFLRVIAYFDWAMAPLIVDVNGELTMKDRGQIMYQFTAKRKEFQREVVANKGGAAMYIATPYDLESESWTSLLPDNQVVKRLIAYARSSSELLTNLINGKIHDRWESLFRTPLECYDALIQLHMDKLAYPHQILFKAGINEGSTTVANWVASKDFCPYLSSAVLKKGVSEARNHLLVGFDPVKYYLHDLKTYIPKGLNVWYDAFGSEIMGLTWSKDASFMTTTGQKRKREDADPIVLDARNILQEIGGLGEGLVKCVHLLKLP